jgi:hypothetical protein
MPKVTRIVPGRHLITVVNRTDFGNLRRVFLTKKINQFLFLAVEDIPCLVPPYTRQEKNHSLFPGKNVFISLHGSNFILINKTILLHKYFKINLCILFC